MNDNDFKELVLKMRKLQKDYFRTKNANFLIEAKEIERQVDTELEKYEQNKYGNSLF